jgi:poly-gamma-glutamate capsule biosynthesis protein CapA/YwtB (metallophosphatase superfamily)/uncharacterized protein with PIN domain
MKKFLCDQMCAELGRWLRTAGYDTVIISASLQDQKIFQQAVEEKRLLLTRDKHFKELDPERKTVIYLRGEDLDGWAGQLLRDEGINWLFCPFSRCLQCNSLFEKIPPPDDSHEQIPKHVKEFCSCPTCGKIFWLGSHTTRMENQLRAWQNTTLLTIGLGGDLMIGRLVDEHLDHVSPSYVWGNLLPVLRNTDFNLVNLENALTDSEKIFPKVFNFKATPEKVTVLTEGQIHAVNLANNHILDFSEEGLLETLQVLERANILHIGAGKDLEQARASCIVEKEGIKIGLLGCTDNEPSWKATTSRPGTHFIEVGDLTSLRKSIVSLRDQVDLLILSIHWGPNMRQRPLPHFRSFAYELIDLGVDILHGHSAHIFQGVEIYKKKLILYDTGDLIDDYAVDPFLRNDHSFFFIVKLDKKKLISLKMIPTFISRFQVNISHENEQLEAMKVLCNELKTFPVREDHSLLLDLD